MKSSNSNERIHRLLAYYELTQTAFCKRANIQKSALSNYLSGVRVPRQDQIDSIAEAFSVSPAWLMGYDVPMFEESTSDITDFEAELLKAYRNSPDYIKESINKLLDLKKESEENNENS